jgi:hypothetical protein
VPYFRFSLVFVAIYLGVLAFITREANWLLVEWIVFVGVLIFLGSTAVLVFFYRNKALIENYSKEPRVEILLKILFGIQNSKKGGKPDA